MPQFLESEKAYSKLQLLSTFAKESLEGLLFVVFGDARAEGAVDLVVCRPIFLYPKP